jgi:hypothetical protein
VLLVELEVLLEEERPIMLEERIVVELEENKLLYS